MNIWRWAVLAGLGVLAIGIAFGKISNIDACHLSGDPILEFEFVTSTADVAARFPEHCREAHLEAQENGLWLDALFFIPTYSAFLILSLIGLKREGGPASRLAGPAVLLVLAAALSDQVEGTQLFRIIGGFPGTQEIIDLLIPAVRIKFALLTLVTLIIGVLHIVQPGWRKLAGLVIALGSLASFYGLAYDHGVMGLANLIGWSVLLLANLILAVRKDA